jgi:site-specific DNA recombinase
VSWAIIRKLREVGVRITKQNISSMWRRAFYCGILTNAFLEGKPLKGKWEPIVSEEVFWGVQQILDGNHQDYQIERNNDSRPLVGTIFCPDCGKKLTGYEVKKKKLHYYKCQTCKGRSINSVSSIKMKTKGAHEMFLELLESFKMDERFIQPFIFLLKEIFKGMKAQTFEERKEYEKRIKDLTQELETLDERFAYGKFDDDALYQKLRMKKQTEINQVKEKLDGTDYEISNLDYYIEKSIELSQNIHNYWYLGSLDVKKKIQKLVFPEGIVVDTTNRTYLTSNVNSFFLVKSQFMRTSGDKKEKLPIKNDEDGGRIARFARVPLRITAQRKSHAMLRIAAAFLFPFLRIASESRTENKKAWYFRTWLFFVAEGGFEPPTFGL